MKAVRMLMAVLCMLFLSTGAYAYNWDQIDLENTYGTGDNTALLIVDFSDDDSADDSFAWAVNFSDPEIGYTEILGVVEINDANFSVEWNGSFVKSITYGSENGPYDPTWTNYWYSNTSTDLGETWDGYASEVGDDGTVGWLYTDAAYPSSPGNPAIPTNSVPIPGAVLLFGSGLVGLIGLKRKKG